MTRALAALLCLAALLTAAPAAAEEEEDKIILAGQIIDKMPLWAEAGEAGANQFLRTRVLPLIERRGVKKAMAAALAEEMTFEELSTYRMMLDNGIYRSVLAKLGRANARMQSIFNTEMGIAIRCTPFADRPEALRRVGEFTAAEKDRFCD